MSRFSDEILARISRCGVVAVLVVDDAENAIPLGEALLDGGIDVMELTLRTPAAIVALRQIRQHLPKMLAGVGTVLTGEQVRAVAEAKGAFGVAPGTNPTVLREAQRVGLPFAPGIATPSDLELALEHGCREVKFFPAQACGGLSYLRNIAAPYSHLGVRYIPLGGLTVPSIGEYLAEPSVLALGGSWLAPRAAIQGHHWEEIRCNAAAARQAVDRARSAAPSGKKSG
jgi:2-dehydro-3-deoxyphosphogluconate aldolase/(4S)-4-hydroxy-2-oxoglutarate aldolase